MTTSMVYPHQKIHTFCSRPGRIYSACTSSERLDYVQLRASHDVETARCLGAVSEGMPGHMTGEWAPVGEEMFDVMCMQAHWRGREVREEVARQRSAALTLQKHWRTARLRRAFQADVACIVLAQAALRRYSARSFPPTSRKEAVVATSITRLGTLSA